jgi:hypothetical protein
MDTASYRRLADATARALDISFCIAPFEGGALMFHSFGSWSGWRTARKGNGKIAMRFVCRMADRLGTELVLWAAHENLIPYYEAFGFTLTPHPTIRNFMRRTPATEN